MRWFLSLFLISSFAFSFDSDFEIENTNIISKYESKDIYDYNRLRFYSTFTDEKYENLLFKIIVDNYNNYDNELEDNDNKTKIYRTYFKYSDEKNIIIIGKQRIFFGVGRVWNPIDIYNPIDATSIETDERKGTDSISYNYAISDLTSLDAVISEDKYAFRIKGYLDIADMGLSVLKDKDENQTIFGYEISGEFLDTGIELRSEGGYFDSEKLEDYKELIIGAEYSFENSLTLLGEYKYNSSQSQDYLALNLSYTISMLWECSYLGIKNLDDESTINLLKLDYNFSDDMELNFGAYLYTGDKNSEYGSLDNRSFVRYFIHF